MALQQQTALLAASAGISDDGHPLGLFNPQSISGPTLFTSARHRRSSSSLSGRSARSGSIPFITDSVGTGITPARDPGPPAQRPSLRTVSRQSSYTSRPSTTSSPIAAHFPNTHSPSSERFPMPNSTGATAQPVGAPHARQSNPHAAAATTPSSASNGTTSHLPSAVGPITSARYEEASQRRSELELVKQENQSLRARVQELERSLRRQSGDALPTDAPSRSK